jgi:hypothetical protein
MVMIFHVSHQGQPRRDPLAAAMMGSRPGTGKLQHAIGYAVLGVAFMWAFAAFAARDGTANADGERQSEGGEGALRDSDHSNTHAAGSGRVAWVAFLAWMSASGYGALDELHQAFVPGRTGCGMDVAIDSLGAFLGCAVAACGVVAWLSLTRKRGSRD